MGMKCSDYLTVPVCREHHQRFHDAGTVLDWWTAQDTRALFMETQVSILVEWIERKEER